MTLPTQREPDTFHYITSVTFNRVEIFRHPKACEIFFVQLVELKRLFPFKLIGYVLMPDHFHMIVNLPDGDVEKFLLRLRGNSARKILDWLLSDDDVNAVSAFELAVPQKRNHRLALWQKTPHVVELYSHKFLRQKLRYIHLNPVRAGLCDDPADYRWSSYQAYVPFPKFEAPIPVDRQPFWKESEKETAIAIAARNSRRRLDPDRKN